MRKLAVASSPSPPKKEERKAPLNRAERISDKESRRPIRENFPGGEASCFSLKAMMRQRMVAARTPRAIRVVLTIPRAKYGEGQKIKGAKITVAKIT